MREASVMTAEKGKTRSDGSQSPGAPPLIITIDGPAGTGKSTVAHRLAKKLGLDFLDTGAMYRAAALLALETGIVPDDGEALARAVSEQGIRFDWSADPPVILLGARDVSLRVRDMDVNAIVSIVAAQPKLRAVLVEQQRQIAREHPRLVSEGRDQGSVVFPNAHIRFYLDADVTIRAQRRIEQLRAQGKSIDEETVVEDIKRRDELDAARELAPLVQPEGACIVQTGHRDIDEVVHGLETVVRRELRSRGIDA